MIIPGEYRSEENGEWAKRNDSGRTFQRANRYRGGIRRAVSEEEEEEDNGACRNAHWLILTTNGVIL